MGPVMILSPPFSWSNWFARCKLGSERYASGSYAVPLSSLVSYIVAERMTYIAIAMIPWVRLVALWFELSDCRREEDRSALL